ERQPLAADGVHAAAPHFLERHLVGVADDHLGHGLGHVVLACRRSIMAPFGSPHAILEHVPFLRKRNMLSILSCGACSCRRTGVRFAATCAGGNERHNGREEPCERARAPRDGRFCAAPRPRWSPPAFRARRAAPPGSRSPRWPPISP